MTRRPTDIITAMRVPLKLFEERCEDKTTLRKLIALADDRARRKEAHALFSEIRQKNLKAYERKDEFAITQYSFEEICAKTLYNLTHEPAPFDPDSAFWVLPLALDLGRKLGITDPAEISPLLKLN